MQTSPTLLCNLMHQKCLKPPPPQKDEAKIKQEVDMQLRTHAYIHTLQEWLCIHTYLRTCIHTDKHTLIETYTFIHISYSIIFKYTKLHTHIQIQSHPFKRAIMQLLCLSIRMHIMTNYVKALDINSSLFIKPTFPVPGGPWRSKPHGHYQITTQKYKTS